VASEPMSATAYENRLSVRGQRWRRIRVRRARYQSRPGKSVDDLCNRGFGGAPNKFSRPPTFFVFCEATVRRARRFSRRQQYRWTPGGIRRRDRAGRSLFVEGECDHRSVPCCARYLDGRAGGPAFLVDEAWSTFLAPKMTSPMPPSSRIQFSLNPAKFTPSSRSMW
jgi:hypothetical protein